MQLVDYKAEVVDVAALSNVTKYSTLVRKVDIADETAALIITLWGHDAEHVALGKSYNFCFSVNFDMGEYPFYTQREGRPMIPIEPLENFLHEFSLRKERNSYQHKSSDCQTSPLISCVASPSSARRCPSSQIAPSPAALCAALYRKLSRSSTNSALCSRCKPRWCEKYSLLPMPPRLPKFIRRVEDVDEFAIGATPPFTSAASSAPAAAAAAKRSLCFEEPQELRDAPLAATTESDMDVLSDADFLASLSDKIASEQNCPKRSKSGNSS